MTWFFISRFDNATLPGAVSNSLGGRTLQRAMDLIVLKEYDEARKLWCQDVLALSSHQSHNLFGSLNWVFHSRLPGLSRVTRRETTLCSSPYCSKANVTRSHAVTEFDVGSQAGITQETVDSALQLLGDGFSWEMCSAKLDPITTTSVSADYWKVATAVSVMDLG